MAKIDKSILYFIYLFFIISIFSIYQTLSILPTYMDDILIKQIIWYIIGFFIIFIIVKMDNKIIFKYYKFYYLLFVILLIGLFFFAPVINNAVCWYKIPLLGSFQPSEFMKIILIINIAYVLDGYTVKTKKDEFFLLLKIFFIFFIPAFLTYLQPDTGIVIIYLIITVTMIFTSKLSLFWYIVITICILMILLIFVFIYFFDIDLFIKIFGDNFLRINRIINWTSNDGYQLQNGMAAIGGGGLFGYLKTPIYFPEPHTDFIFATYASNLGFFGSVFLITTIVLFDIKLINVALKQNKKNKYIVCGIIGMLFYQQVQNIAMTFGLLPITGITLPFISYGGSSLISYMILIGIVLNMTKKTTI
ncbi:MAG: FtsW/RodA/SpoVE family cell cycle protein [Mycoplasmatota bacterium]